MKRFPNEFEALLSRRGRRVLAGREERVVALSPSRPFVALSNLLDPQRSTGCLRLLERHFTDVLTLMEDPIPPWTISGMTENYGELLPKTVRVRTALLESRRSRAWARAHETGLLTMLRSQSFHAFAQALSGHTLRTGFGTQLLCYGEGDYAGPHNDHHPEEETAKDGYVDLHLTFANPSVDQQWLVYACGGHFSELANVATVGGVTCYLLPFWHYTTPLTARPKARTAARRWVLLGTFLKKRAARGPGTPAAAGG